jgi:hypothetical protein
VRVEQDLDAHASLSLERAKQMYVQMPDRTHRRLLARAAETARNDGLPRDRVLFWLRVTDADLDGLLEFLRRDEAGVDDSRFLVQVQPLAGEHPTDAMPRHTATLAEAEEVADGIWETIGNSDARIFITDEQTGEQRYRGTDGSWGLMSGPIDYGSKA